MTGSIASADAVVIGGGVMGCSILYNLAVRGLTNALLLERDVIGAGSTGRSSSAIRMHYSTEIHARMAWLSLAVFRNFDDLVGGQCGYTRTGQLLFAGEADAPTFRANIAMQQRVGIDTRLATREEARELAPAFYLDDCAAIAYEPLSGYGDASATAAAYGQRARQAGARILLRTPALGIAAGNGRVQAVRTSAGVIATERVVVATGPWSRRFLLRQGIDLPLEATRHEVLHLRRPPEGPAAHPGGGDLINRIYFRPEGSDLTLVGNGNMTDVVEDPEVFAQRASPGFILDVWRRITRRIPSLARAQLAAGYAGLYTSTPDSHSIIDAVAGIEGLYVCTGFSGHGFKLAPVVGQAVAELMLTGRAAVVDLAPLRMSRFAEGQLNHDGYGFKVMV